MYNELVSLIRNIYETKEIIPLHEPAFRGNEKEYLLDTINSSNVSSSSDIGSNISKFEKSLATFIGADEVISTINGTSALHASLYFAGVHAETEVLTQSLTFVATCNAIKYCNANPIFIDVDKSTLSMSHHDLEIFLESNCEVRNDGFCWNKISNKRISACLPNHTFGFPAKINEIKEICNNYNIKLIEDAAGSLGSKYKSKHLGLDGSFSALSFNGNKIITTGGGGAIICNDKGSAKQIRGLISTARSKHKWLIEHYDIGFNYRLPNVNAAIGLAQLELLPKFLEIKKEIAKRYQEWGEKNNILFFSNRKYSDANFWLNTLIANDRDEKNKILEYLNSRGITSRPAWTPMHMLDMYKECLRTDQKNTEWFYDRIVNLPSSVIINKL